MFIEACGDNSRLNVCLMHWVLSIQYSGFVYFKVPDNDLS